jgi:hypothetical protein
VPTAASTRGSASLAAPMRWVALWKDGSSSTRRTAAFSPGDNRGGGEHESAPRATLGVDERQAGAGARYSGEASIAAR